MALSPGDTLLNSHYRILRLLGRGGFGFVYLAQDTLLDEPVAIKELIPALVGDETMLKRFLTEAKATMRLRHKRIVGTHNVFSESGNYYIVMEYMPGGSLEDRLREQGALPIEQVVRISAEVCEGLSCAHEEGVVHCDLKPANILFDAGGEAKVADFGIAHVSGEMLTRTWITPAGFVAGTLPYMSPEQADGVRDDPRIDIYALGAVLYRMLTGQPYLEFDQRETPGAQADNVYRIRNQTPVPPRRHSGSVPTWLDSVVLKALAKRPEGRYASADQFRTALLEQQIFQEKVSSEAAQTRLVGDKSVPVVSDSRAESATTHRSSVPAWFLPSAGVAVVLLILVGYAIVRLVAVGGEWVARTPESMEAEPLLLSAGTESGATEIVVATPIAAVTVMVESTPAPMSADAIIPSLTPTPNWTPAPSWTSTPIIEPSATSTSIPTPGSAAVDQVVAFNLGPGAEAKYSNPDTLLGEPDLVEDPCCRGMVQLGQGGSVLLAFTDNAIVDEDGPDFQVYGESAGDDFLLVETSADGRTWYSYPRVGESPNALDLADVGLAQAVFVRLTDWQPATATGAELDAVMALHSGPGLDSLPDLPDAVSRVDLTLHEGPDERMKEAGQVPAGSDLVLLARSGVDGWAKVEARNGLSGWSSLEGLALNVSLSDYVVAQAPPTPISIATVPATTTPTPELPAANAARRRSKDGMEMVIVPAGEFVMGSADNDPDAYDDEQPQHTVYLDIFWIDRTEVTNAQYRACIEAGACGEPWCWQYESHMSQYGGPTQPVVCATWYQATDYCAWAGARLPSEAEWEKAARGIDGRTYPWGMSKPDCTKAHHNPCAQGGNPRVAPVGTYLDGASPYGVLDMAGNVNEWVADWYNGDYYGQSPHENPSGPREGEYRVYRGGSWQVADSKYVRTARRQKGLPTDAGMNDQGFRCAFGAFPR